MNNLTTQKILLGLLMALVLAFSVQGTAEALTLTETSPVVQSKRMGSTFEMTFRVGLTGNTVQYHPDYSNRRINANNHESPYQYIDNQGYAVTYIGETSRSYRNTNGAPAGELVVDPRPTYSTNSDGSAADPAEAGNPSGTYLVDTSGNLYDSDGNAVYIQRGGGDRTAADPWTYTRATLSNTTGIETADRVENTISALHDYNDEAIGITIMRPGNSSTGGTLKLKNSSYNFNGSEGTGITDGSDDAARADDAAFSLKEREGTIGLPGTINLVYEGASEGTHTIKIWDATPLNDFPLNALPNVNRPRSSVTFTIHVTPSTFTPGDEAPTISPDIQRIPTNDDVEPVSDYLMFSDGNNRIRYEVVRGSGTLYVGTLEDEYEPPSTVRSEHQDSDVYLNTNGTSNEVHVWFAGEDRSAPRATIIFEYKGQPVPTTTTNQQQNQQNQQNQQQTTPNRLGISLSGSGSTRTVTVNALQAGTTSTSGIFTTLTTSGGSLSPTSGATPLTSTWTLPSAAGTYTVSASTTAGYNSASDSVTVTVPGTLTAVQEGQLIRVTASPAPSSNLAFTLTRGGVPAGGGEILTAGWGRAIPTGLTTGSHILTVNATGYNATQVTFTPGATTTTTTTTTGTTTTGPAGVADSLEIDGSRQLSRNVNQATPLRVRVVDVNNRGVSDVRVTFRVLAPGQGRLSQRGNGRAVQVNTDRNGYASASLNPLGGDVIVEAKAAGVSASVTFIIDVSGTTTTPTPTPTPSTDAPSSQMINPEDADVHVGAAQRSPMLWVDNGAIYALVDADVQRFAPSVENALHITVGGNKVYWTAQTGTSSGTINSANLDGSGVTELKSIMAVPIGIAVDTDARKLYWTNSRGRIQSANLNGSSVTNELQNLEGAKDIAVARGLVYWTQFDTTTGQGRLGIMNPNAGQNGTRYISTGSDSPMSLTINGNKVYWTEQTGVSSGTINSANLNGSGVNQLASIRAVPSGMGVDMARSHLYWTNSRGRIQRADLDGKQIQNVADGLGSPGDMVLSNSIPTPTAVTSTTPTPTPTADNAQYDVNGDGLVNNTDASLVAGAMNTSNTKYDVNGDGTVNFLDLLLVFDNRDAGAASAPTIVGMKLSAVQVDVLQEQIDLLIATNDRSPAAMRTLIYLQQLIATARPEKTQLLANYPNPFNPETWIPYELATDTNVRLTIYNTHGVAIRTLELGHQSSGYYVGRDRAAYWDGRNALGEQVASGIYFYQFETDTMSSMRKMVILK